MENRILNKAKELFFSFGIRSVTMDDIAKEMGVSKKTIYQFFPDKNAIVEKVIGELIQGHGEKIESYSKDAENAIHEVALQTQTLVGVLQSIKPGIFFEVQKYFPSTWEAINDHRHDCMLQSIIRNLQRGTSEGLYRSELDIEVVAHIRLTQLHSVLNQQEFPPVKFSFKTALGQITEIYLYGIASLEGHKIISKYLTVNNHK